jgi:hypothetical protein
VPATEQTECLTFAPFVVIGTPPPRHPQASVSSPPWVLGGGGGLQCTLPGGESQFWTRGQTLWYSRYKCTLWCRPFIIRFLDVCDVVYGIHCSRDPASCPGGGSDDRTRRPGGPAAAPEQAEQSLQVGRTQFERRVEERYRT